MTTLMQDIQNLPQELEEIGEWYYAAIVRGLVKKLEELQAEKEGLEDLLAEANQARDSQ